MTKISVKPTTADKKDWTKYMDELKKETAECLIENQVPWFSLPLSNESSAVRRNPRWLPPRGFLLYDWQKRREEGHKKGSVLIAAFCFFLVELRGVEPLASWMPFNFKSFHPSSLDITYRFIISYLQITIKTCDHLFSSNRVAIG
jgi:hypothetical protein